MPDKDKLNDNLSSVSCHNIKIESKYFDRVISGEKSFEIRRDDRDYKEGDFVVLNEILSNGFVTGRIIEKRIGFVTDYYQMIGYCVFSLLDL